jgi:hypothetical protein
MNNTSSILDVGSSSLSVLYLDPTYMHYVIILVGHKLKNFRCYFQIIIFQLS